MECQRSRPIPRVKPSGPQPAGEGSGTRERVIRAALDSIHQYGYRNASSNKIAEHAGVTWGVIQYHFKTREGLMLAVLQTATDAVNARIDAIDGMLAGHTFDARYDVWECLVLESFGYPRFPAIIQIAMDLGRDPSAAQDTIAELNRYQATIRRLVGLAAQLGGDVALPRDLADYVYWSSWSVALAEAMSSYLNDSDDPRAQDRRAALRSTTRTLVAGVLPPTGRR